MGFPFKAKSNMNREELTAAIDEKKALPDMVLKRVYFTAQEAMNIAESNLMLNYYKSGGFWNDFDIYRFRSSILVVFRLISGMINEAGVTSWPNSETPSILIKNKVKTDFDLCLKLVRYARLDVFTLIHLCGYLNWTLHEIGLTNLLIDNREKEINIEDLV